jgi:hypothetical protein
MKKVVGLIVVIVLAIILVSVLAKKDVDEYVLDNFIDEANAVVLAEQVPGDRTVVSYTKLSKPGYVLVYGEDEKGEKIFLGSSDLLPAGDSFNVIVKHRSEKRTSSDTKVTAVAVADDGDGVFDLEIDNDQIADESEADVDADAKDPAVLTIVEIGELIEDAGFDVTAEEALQTETSETIVDDAGNEMMDSDTGADATVKVEPAA